MHEMITERAKTLPIKAQPDEDTQVYWLEPASHKNFSYDGEQLRNTLVAVTDCSEGI